jgi:hypothetical protein
VAIPENDEDIPIEEAEGVDAFATLGGPPKPPGIKKSQSISNAKKHDEDSELTGLTTAQAAELLAKYAELSHAIVCKLQFACSRDISRCSERTRVCFRARRISSVQIIRTSIFVALQIVHTP